MCNAHNKKIGSLLFSLLPLFLFVYSLDFNDSTISIFLILKWKIIIINIVINKVIRLA